MIVSERAHCALRGLGFAMGIAQTLKTLLIGRAF